MSKKYHEGTPLLAIIQDGWSRGFEVEQTLEEARDMGYAVDRGYIVKTWLFLDEEMERDLNPSSQPAS